MADEGLVRWRHRIIAQPVRPHPFQLLMFPWDRLASPPPTYEKWHQDMKFSIIMTGERQRCEAGLANRNGQFLGQFADDRVLRRLTFLDLSTRKFPKPRHGLAGRALGDKDP